MPDLDDAIILNQDVGIFKGDDIVLRIMLQHGAVLKKKSGSHANNYS
ncbi:hypothetical protein FVER14953_21559 [Fusarium verticillioides]|nr:hypothetical protein FVER14953_21559 [Fusarium verticillioides]